jgi:alpha-L-rhamnosidase
MSAEVLVVASDLSQTGDFSCSDARVNQLFSNVRWSQRGNFLSLPTDCPQRDERLGWTGDIQVFAQAACANADADAFLASWLRDLALEQRENGCVASVIPNVLGQKGAAWGACGWGDAATVVPWRLCEAYGDLATLARQYPSMRGWVDWCASRCDAEGCWTGDFQFGDWLDPAAPPDKPNQATTSGDYIATAYLSFSARLVAKTAALLGEADAAGRYDDLSRQTAAAAWTKWGAEALTTQAGCAVAIELGVVPAGELQAAADALAALVNHGEGRIATGFLGTPLVLPALCRGGHYEAAYRLLMNPECPGWLHQVLAGATTMWERWDAIRADGSILGDGPEGTPGSNMSSFNHYAYGAVAAWLYRTVAGIAPGAPGYAEVLFAPVPGGGLTHACAEIATQFGKSAISWVLQDDGGMTAEVTVAPGAQGRFVAPPGDWSVKLDGVRADTSGARPDLALGSGAWTIELAPR